VAGALWANHSALRIGTIPQSSIPNPQSPIPNPH